MSISRKKLKQLLIEHVPEDGTTIGNGRLRQAIADATGQEVDPDAYDAVRDELVAEGVLVKGQGRGGTLRLAGKLKRALHTYTESGGKGDTAVDQQEAVAVMLERYECCCDPFHGFDWSLAFHGTAAQRLSVIPAAQEHVLAQDDGKRRVMQAVTKLGKAFALAVPHEEAIRIRDDVGFFQQVRACIAKLTATDKSLSGDLEAAIRQIVSRAVSSGEVIDIFAAAGLRKPGHRNPARRVPGRGQRDEAPQPRRRAAAEAPA